MRHPARRHADRLARWGAPALLALLWLPLLLGTGYSTWRTLWFKFAAASTIGTVVDKRGLTAPTLVVQYTDATGEPLRIESAGSDFYRDIDIGASIQVLHDPRDPSDARLDLFIENWVAPLLLGTFSAVIGLSAGFIGWQVWRA